MQTVRPGYLAQDPDFDWTDFNAEPVPHCTHPHRRIDHHTGKLYCRLCGQNIPQSLIDAEVAATMAAPTTPEMELPV